MSDPQIPTAATYLQLARAGFRELVFNDCELAQTCELCGEHFLNQSLLFIVTKRFTSSASAGIVMT
ncbi:MAG: hypothetical protein JWO80_432 [Bryobacterales bacterium]|nr:hypothetical protein [Bryobacterales bacterium]